MITLYIISVAVFALFISTVIVINGVPKSISESYYILGEKVDLLASMFTFFCWLTAIPLLIFWLENDGGILAFVACGALCFVGCSSLTSIDIPENVTSIGEHCFDSCTSFTSITLPESVTSLGEYCFAWCDSLILATVLPAIPPTIGVGAFDYTHESFIIKVRSPYVNDYKTATNWNEYASIISAI